MIELWELVDINKNKTGKIHERGKESSIPQGMYHLVAEVWTKNKKGEILLTQRHPDKNYGLMWECTGGSVVAGEESVDAAVRELVEETGLLVEKEALKYLGDTVKDYYIVDTYLYMLEDENPELRLQAEEVVGAMWIPVDEVASKKEMIVEGAWERFCQFEEQLKKLS